MTGDALDGTPEAGNGGGLGSLVKALGEELDKHVGWHMHRGVMVSGLVEAVMRSGVIAAAEQRGRETGEAIGWHKGWSAGLTRLGHWVAQAYRISDTVNRAELLRQIERTRGADQGRA